MELIEPSVEAHPQPSEPERGLKMVMRTISIEFSSSTEEELRERLAGVLAGKSADEQNGVVQDIKDQLEAATGLTYDLASGTVSGEQEVDVPEDVNQQIEDDPLTEESFLVNENDSQSSEFEDKLTTLVEAMG